MPLFVLIALDLFLNSVCVSCVPTGHVRPFLVATVSECGARPTGKRVALAVHRKLRKTGRSEELQRELRQHLQKANDGPRALAAAS